MAESADAADSKSVTRKGVRVQVPPSAQPAVLLDLDDTRFDHTPSSLAGLAALQERFAPLGRLSLEQLAKIHAQNLEAMHDLVLLGELSIDEARLARFRALAADVGASSLDAGELVVIYRDAYQRARRAVPGAAELLLALRGRATVGVVTNNVVVEQLDKLVHLHMKELVDVLVISEEAGVRKPDPAIFHLALARCGASADDAVMIGDSWGSDVLGARAAGVRAVWLNRAGRNCPAPAACTEIKSLLPTESVLELLLGVAATP